MPMTTFEHGDALESPHYIAQHFGDNILITDLEWGGDVTVDTDVPSASIKLLQAFIEGEFSAACANFFP